MGFQAEEESIQAHLLANWTETNVFVENSGLEPAKGSEYVSLSVVNVQSDQVDFGKTINRYRHDGLIVCAIVAESGEGASKAKGWADSIAAIFRSARFDGIVCLDPRIDVIPKNVVERYQINVITAFYRDEFF